MTEPAINLRPATSADARLLFGWVNAPDALTQKEQTTRPIEWNDHCSWLELRLADSATLLLIVEEGRSPVGQVRLEPRGGVHVIDIYIAPAARGRGLARAALKSALDRAGIGAAVARVKGSNTASRHLFESAGFFEAGREGEIMIYRIERAGARNG